MGYSKSLMSRLPRLVVKNPPANAGDISNMGLIPGTGKSPGGGYDNPLQYSCLENPMDREAWWVTVHRLTKSRTWLKRLSTHWLSGKCKSNHNEVLPYTSQDCCCCCCSVALSCPTLCNPMDCSMPGLPVHHHLQSLLKLMSNESVTPSNHLIFCHPLILPPSIFLSSSVFSNELALLIRQSN